ncbi:MAG: DNA mismatch repair protein MutS [Candidatus Shikimatogenerans sp. JK-2022]|nr:DNA mismatch repair protein MutS [Candidatus Shikimatogenerans bostrichidophilus]
MYKETPLIKQYYNLKTNNSDCILFFQVGDFYEIFGYDAIICSRLLDLTLTKRNKNSIYLVGFPCNSLIIYINKLTKLGYKVAICDQNNENKKDKFDLINREITNIISPGITLYDNINKKKNITKFIAFLFIDKNYENFGISFLDFSTGEFLTTQGNIKYIKYIILNFNPKEFFIQKSKLFFFKKNFINIKEKIINLLDDNLFNYYFTLNQLLKHFNKKKLYKFKIINLKYSIISSGLLIYYIKKNYNLNLNHIKILKKIKKNLFLFLDENTIKNLEIIKSINKNGKSLLEILDYTSTSMGYRLLNNWIIFPSKKYKIIKYRQKILKFFFKKNKNNKFKMLISYNLKNIYDIEKLLSKITNKKILPNQLYKLFISLNKIFKILKIIKFKNIKKLFCFKKKKILKLNKIYNKIKNILIKNPINQFNKKFFIKNNVSNKLDNYKLKLKKKKKKIYRYYLIKIKKKLNIKFLNINNNNLIGYYIEIKKNDIKNIPKNWIIKQKLNNIFRYTTNILNKYEYFLFYLKNKIFNLEKKIYNNTIYYLNKNIIYLKNISNLIAKIDVIFSFFLLAKNNNYIKPKIHKNNLKNNFIKIIKGRHPVIEKNIKYKYVPNNIYIDNKNFQILIITGPNMSGKSALLRQTALIVIMSQIGSYVPAKKVEICIIDQIFSRIGASDNISIGISTFMLEMKETSYILNNFNKNSLIIMDELGRGTSTYDGISLAYSIIKFFKNSILKPKLLFTTHYYELNNLLKKYNNIKYFYLSIKKKKKKIKFIRKLKHGIVKNSYGIYIAELSGIPNEIIKNAKIIFNKFKNKNFFYFFLIKIKLLFNIILNKLFSICDSSSFGRT